VAHLIGGEIIGLHRYAMVLYQDAADCEGLLRNPYQQKQPTVPCVAVQAAAPTSTFPARGSGGTACGAQARGAAPRTLPARSTNGTPAQRSLLMVSLHAAKVGALLPCGTVSSSR
jgi:hypothetical protein